ncbi:MAG: flap endonuclease, partial [Verrucomicrobiota bacterium]
MIVHLIDGTYELFRHFYGLRRFTKGKDRPYGAVVGVLQTVLQIIENENGATYLGVATDHVIESFRNKLWADYKTGAGIERALQSQFHPLEETMAAMGVVVWPMVELEADDGLASAAHLAAKERKFGKIATWTPDKDLGQCVRGTRVVQIDGRRKIVRDAAGIREKFGVDPLLIPDLLALVGDAADGYPGIP